MIDKVFIIAEIGQAHDGSLGIAHSYIDALAETGVDAVKFQTHIAEAESSEYEQFRINFSYEDNSRFDYWKRMEFSKEQWYGLKIHCEEKGLEFISSPFSNAAVDLLESLNVNRYKIGSGEVNNYLLLEKVARTKKPIILSSGMSDWDDIEEVIKFLKLFNNDLSLLQCTTAYPTIPGQFGVKVIPELKRRFNLKVGFSDHSGKIYPSIAAVALGAEILEFHSVFHKSIFGPDSKASLTMEEIKELVISVRGLEDENKLFITKFLDDKLVNLKNIFGKSLAINRSMREGEKICFEDLEAKKPSGHGIDSKRYREVIGKTLNKDLSEFVFLNFEDIYDS